MHIASLAFIDGQAVILLNNPYEFTRKMDKPHALLSVRTQYSHALGSVVCSVKRKQHCITASVFFMVHGGENYYIKQWHSISLHKYLVIVSQMQSLLFAMIVSFEVQ